MLQIVKPNTNIPFMYRHKPFTILIVLLVIASFVLPFVYEPNWGTSFRGGSSITVHFDEEVGIDQVRTAFESDSRFKSVSVKSLATQNESSYVIRTRSTTTLVCSKLDALKQSVPAAVAAAGKKVNFASWPACDSKDEGIRGDFFIRVTAQDEAAAADKAADGKKTAAVLEPSVLAKAFQDGGLDATVEYDDVAKRYVVKPGGIQSDVISLLTDKFGAKFNPASGLDEIVTVGADVGSKFRSDAIIAIVLALSLMLLYIYIRFDLRYAPAAVVSLAASTIITFLLINALQLEITLETVAALLSIVGYGINDTIVNFDRVRENVVTEDEASNYRELVNRSINECLSRTILTSVTTVVAILPMAIFATGATQDFAIIMVFGVFITTFNTILVSTPMVIWLDEWFKKNAKRSAARRKMAMSAGDDTATA